MRNFSTLFLAILFAITAQTIVAQATKLKPNIYALDADVLFANKEKLKSKNSELKPAYDQLLADAKEALKFGPVSVMEKTNNPPSGDKHDYMSLAPYYWPNPATKDGLPYIRKDGETNPEVRNYKDKDNMPPLCHNVYTLSLAYFFSGEEKYAAHAANLIRVWFLDKETRMNPNLNYAQAMRGHNYGRGAGLIDTRHFIEIVEAMGFLEQSKQFTKNDVVCIKQWFAEFLNWMQTSENGREEMSAKNNHGMWYDAQRLSFSLFTNQLSLAKEIVTNAKKRLDSQMDENGNFPLELARTTSLHYSLFVMDALMQIAKMAKHVDINMFAYTSSNGNSIQKGFDALYPYLVQEKVWQHEQIKPFNFNEGIDILGEASENFNCATCKKSIFKIHPKNPEKLRIFLLTKND